MNQLDELKSNETNESNTSQGSASEVTWFLQLREKSLYEEYRLFCRSRQVNGFYESLLVGIFVLGLFLIVISTDIRLVAEYTGRKTLYQPIILITFTVFALVSVLGYCVKRSSTPILSKLRDILPSDVRLLSSFLLNTLICVDFLVVIQAANGQCGHNRYPGIYLVCHSVGDIGLLPLSAVVIVYLPALVLLLFPTVSLRTLLAAWIAQLITMITAIIIMNSTLALNMYVMLIIPATLILYTSCRDRLLFFVTHMKYKSMANKHHEETLRAMDRASRSMAANAAHDLKTVSDDIFIISFVIYLLSNY